MPQRDGWMMYLRGLRQTLPADKFAWMRIANIFKEVTLIYFHFFLKPANLASDFVLSLNRYLSVNDQILFQSVLA